MRQQGLVPLFYDPSPEVAISIANAVYEGGARILEFTNRGPLAHDVFSRLARHCAENLPEMILGVGSVVEPGTASLFIQLGAKFVASPRLNPDLIKACNTRKIATLPGCMTLTEFGTAEELGVDIVKLFPGGSFGPDFIKAVLAPCPWTSIMPTGGVTTARDNLKGWFDAGVACVGIGSALFTDNGNPDTVATHISETLATIKDVRSTE